MNGYRGLDSNKGLLGKLSKGGSLYEITKRVKENNDYWMGIRDNRVMVYYMGGKILEISEKGSLSFDTKYIDHYDKTLQISKKFESTQDWISKEELLRTAIENFQKNNKKNEKIAQQEIMLKNNNAEDAEWFLVDMEYAVSGNPYGRFDMIGITKKPDINGKHRIALIELKTGTNAFGGANANRYGSGIAGHINNFYEFLCGEGGKGKDNVENLAKEIACILSNYTALGIDIGGLQLSLDDIDCSPENVDCIIMCSDIQDKSYATRQVKKYVFNDRGASIYCLENKWGKNFRNKYRRLNVYLSIVDKERVIKGKMFEKLTRERAELHLHTTMSTMDGIGMARDYIDAAIEKGLSGVAVTDHASVQAFPDFYRRIQAYDYNLKLIYGTEVYMRTDESKKNYHASVLVQNKEGLKNLYKLISLANTEYFDKVPLTPKSEFAKHRQGILIGSGCDAGELYSAVKDGKSDEELKEIMSFYDYIEVVPTDNFKYFVNDGNTDLLREINKRIISLAEAAGKITVAVSDAHYPNKNDAICRKVLLHHKKYDNYENQPDLAMKTTDEMLSEFSYLGKEKAYEIVVTNTNKIADKIADLFPPFETEAKYSADKDKLVSLVYEKAHTKYGEGMPERIKDRIEWELEKICSNEKSVLQFLIGTELVGKAVSDGYTVGSRGSVASSLVAFLLGITEVNPLPAHYYCPNCRKVEFHDEYNCGADMADKLCECGIKFKKDGFTIPPETFFGIDDSRDIDVDYNFALEYRKKATEHLASLTGNRTVRCGTVSSIPNHRARHMIRSYITDENKNIPQDSLDVIFEKINNVKCANGVHPGGVFVIPEDKNVYDYTPVNSIERLDGALTTHFDFHDLPQLLKIDILGHDDPSMIKKLEELTGVNSKDIPLDDTKTFELINGGKAIGIHEFGNRFMREAIIPNVYIDSFDTLVRISGISHGTGTWERNAENLLDSGVCFSDIVSCRDDVMLYLVRLGVDREYAFRISEKIRKGRGLTEDEYSELKNKGAEDFRLSSWNKIKYSFPRAHAATYTLYAYRIAYYKAHFPLEFYCAYFNTNADTFINADVQEVLEKPDSIEWYLERQRIIEGKTSSPPNNAIYLIEVLGDMFGAGYSFDSDFTETGIISKFKITDGKIKPIFVEPTIE